MVAPALTTSPAHSPALIAATEKVRAPCISPDGKRVVYEVQPMYRTSDRSTSTLWTADTRAEGSARKITSGQWYDRAPAWLPDGKRVLFLSDRVIGDGKKGTSIWLLDVDGGGETGARAIFREGQREGGSVQGFVLSHDGAFVAFTSQDDPDVDDVRRAKEKDDAKVYGEKRALSRLRVCDLATGSVRTLAVSKDKHLETFAWSGDDGFLIYRLRENRGVEYSAFEVALEKVAVGRGEQLDGSPQPLGTYVSTPSGQTLATSTGHIADLQGFEPAKLLDARALFIHPSTAVSPFTSEPNDQRVQRLYGITNDAVRIVDLGGDGQRAYIAVEVSSGVDSHIDIVQTLAGEREGEVIKTIFSTNEDAIWFGAWDAACIRQQGGDLEFVFAAVLSSGPRHEEPNMYAYRAVLEQPDVRGGTTMGIEHESRTNGRRGLKLSGHLGWLARAPAIPMKVLRWAARDGMQLDGMVRFPPGYQESWGPLPTVLFIHGGPYRRDIPDYMPYFCNWREMLASAGLLVISPNYRGSQGRGHAFAAAAHEGVGANDWADCESMVDEVVRLKLADPKRLAVAGWSHGGSLTAWGVSMTKTKFKAAVVGAGVTNWEGMVMESGSPELERTSRKLSPVNNLYGVKTAVLILHGERDERVPVGQAVGLYRGLKRAAAAEARQSAQLVLYPREPHG
ncbi:Alpha/Beta hydrolase protein [Amylostereum chailletii]|nr:Alpha/Beta hydrolase protein [Amylostereum chailletii]